MDALARPLIVLGALLLVVGLALQLLPSLPLLGKLPGDLRFEWGGFRVYLPLTTCVLLSVVVTALLNLLTRLR